MRLVYPSLVLVALCAACSGERTASGARELLVEPQALSFRGYEGTTATAEVTLTNVGGAALVVELDAEGVGLGEDRFELAAGASRRVQVVARPLETRSGVLRVRAEQFELLVPFEARAEPPPSCTSEGDPCRRAFFDGAEGRCAVELADDGTQCSSECLAPGAVCVSGTCRGARLACDDANACTADFCVLGQGCARVPVSCPAPEERCRVPSCDPVSGCASVVAEDEADCTRPGDDEARVCISGECRGTGEPAPTFGCGGRHRNEYSPGTSDAGFCSVDCWCSASSFPQADAVKDALAVSEREVWFSTNQELLLYNGRTLRQVASPDVGPRRRLWSAGGRLFLSGPNGVAERIGSRFESVHWTFDGRDVTDRFVGVHLDGSPLISTDAGVFRQDPAGWTRVAPPFDVGTREVHVAPNGELWRVSAVAPFASDGGSWEARPIPASSGDRLAHFSAGPAGVAAAGSWRAAFAWDAGGWSRISPGRVRALESSALGIFAIDDRGGGVNFSNGTVLFDAGTAPSADVILTASPAGTLYFGGPFGQLAMNRLGSTKWLTHRGVVTPHNWGVSDDGTWSIRFTGDIWRGEQPWTSALGMRTLDIEALGRNEAVVSLAGSSYVEVARITAAGGIVGEPIHVDPSLHRTNYSKLSPGSDGGVFLTFSMGGTVERRPDGWHPVEGPDCTPVELQRWPHEEWSLAGVDESGELWMFEGNLAARRSGDRWTCLSFDGNPIFWNGGTWRSPSGRLYVFGLGVLSVRDGAVRVEPVDVGSGAHQLVGVWDDDLWLGATTPDNPYAHNVIHFDGVQWRPEETGTQSRLWMRALGREHVVGMTEERAAFIRRRP